MRMQVLGPGWCVTWYPAMPSTTSPAEPEPTHVEVQELDVLGRCASLWAQIGVDLSDQRGVLKCGHAAVCSSSGGVAESIVVCSSTRDKQHASRASRRCSCRGLCGADCRPCRNRQHAKSPSSSLQQLVLGWPGCTDSRAAVLCKGTSNTDCRHGSTPGMHQRPEIIHGGVPCVLQLWNDLEGAAIMHLSTQLPAAAAAACC